MNRGRTCAIFGLAFVAAGASAASVETTYHHVVRDLYPNDERIDVDVTFDGVVVWSANAGSVSPGGTLSRNLEADTRPAQVTVTYHFAPQCCPNRHRDGTEMVTVPFPLGGGSFTVPLDEALDLHVSYDAMLHAQLSVAQGPGTISPTALEFDGDLDGQAFTVHADDAAVGGDVIQARVDTTWELEVSGRLAAGSAGEWRMDPRDLREVPGSPSLEVSFAIAEDPSPAAPPPPEDDRVQPSPSDDGDPDAPAEPDSTPGAAPMFVAACGALAALLTAGRRHLGPPKR